MLEIILIFVAAVVFSVVALGFFVMINLIRLVIWPFKLLLRPAMAGHGPHRREMHRVCTSPARIQPTRTPRVTSYRHPIAHPQIPVATTREPVATTREPVATTREPVVTTREPVVTTRAPVERGRAGVELTRAGLCRNRLCTAPLAIDARFCGRCGFPTPLGMNDSDRMPPVGMPVAAGVSLPVARVRGRDSYGPSPAGRA